MSEDNLMGIRNKSESAGFRFVLFASFLSADQLADCFPILFTKCQKIIKHVHKSIDSFSSFLISRLKPFYDLTQLKVRFDQGLGTKQLC